MKLTINLDHIESPGNPAVVFSEYMGECLRAMHMLETQGRLPEGTTEAVKADALAWEQEKPKAQVAQLDPQHQLWVRFTEREMQERPERVGGYGAGVDRPADL